MRVAVLGSGSGGNATFVHAGNTRVLVDAGFSARSVAERLAILGQDAEARKSLADFSEHLGLAFQIRDDLLDVEGDEEKTGKRLQKDAEAGKATFVSLLGVEGARKAASDEVAAANAALDGFGDRARWLREAARFAIDRTS